jgi:hypothetical protein
VSPIVLIAALSAAVLAQDGGTKPSSTPETPAVSAAASVRPHSDFAGAWKYNEDESVNAATGRPESARAVNERRGAGRGPASGTAGPGPDVSRRGGGGVGVGAGGGGGVPADTLYFLYLQQRDTQRDLMEIAPRVHFDITPAAVTITDDLDRALTFPTDGKKQKYQLGAALFEAKTTWDGGQLKMDIEGPDGLKVAETWFLSEDGSRLYLIIRIGEPGRDGRPVGVNRVYNRLN